MRILASFFQISLSTPLTLTSVLKLSFKNAGDVPGGPAIKTAPSNKGGMGLIPGEEAKISTGSQPKKQKKHPQNINNTVTNYRLFKTWST